MSTLSEPPKSLLFFSILYNSKLINESQIETILKGRVGEGIIYYHPHVPMKKYYSKEMGEEENLKRFFFVARTKTDRRELVILKLWADELERRDSSNSKRMVNIDPGLITPENLILATGKGYSHRIYIEHGVWADLELIYVGTSFQKLPWTYYDYQHPEIIEFFSKQREALFL